MINLVYEVKTKAHIQQNVVEKLYTKLDIRRVKIYLDAFIAQIKK